MDANVRSGVVPLPSDAAPATFSDSPEGGRPAASGRLVRLSCRVGPVATCGGDEAAGAAAAHPAAAALPGSAAASGSDEETHGRDDEDAQPPRRRCKLFHGTAVREADPDDEFALTLEVVDESTVAHCGLQLWRGALLLADWLLHCDVHPDAVGMELGSGLGLCSILLGRLCRTVFATDMRCPGLLFLKRNVARSVTSSSASDVRVRDLNWAKPWPPEYRTDSDADMWTFRPADAAAVADVSVFIAADCLYDTAATKEFCRLLPLILLPGSGRWLWLSLERRIVFSIAERRAHAPAVELFFDLLREDGRLVATQIPIDTIPQRVVEYERTPQLELWRVEPR